MAKGLGVLGSEVMVVFCSGGTWGGGVLAQRELRREDPLPHPPGTRGPRRSRRAGVHPSPPPQGPEEDGRWKSQVSAGKTRG